MANRAGDIAGSILATLCCLWLCTEATRPAERVVVVEERRPGYPVYRRRRRYQNRRGFFQNNDPTVVVVNEHLREPALPLVACTEMVRM